MKTKPTDDSSLMTPVLERNIRALIERRKHEEGKKTRAEKVADSISKFAGSMRFVYLHLALYGLWVFVNLPWSPQWLRFDPSFVMLAMEASVESIFLSTFILITQNRMQNISEKRADLDLQVSLLAEHEITRLITLTKAIANKLEIHESSDPELSELEQDVHPEKVLQKIEQVEAHSSTD
jgi:uncharacterized membrane protein